MSLAGAVDEISRYYVGDRSTVEKILAALVAGATCS
jgi:hypothetical protein